MAGKNSRRVKNEITHNSRQNTKLPPKLKTPARPQHSRQKLFFPPKIVKYHIDKFLKTDLDKAIAACYGLQLPKLFFPPKIIFPPKIKNCQICDFSRYDLYQKDSQIFKLKLPLNFESFP